MPAISSIVRAVGTLTASGNATDTKVVVIGGKTYTLQATLTTGDGHVKIGTDAATTLANLAAAIGLGAGAGTAYAAAMTINPHVRVRAVTATTLIVESKVPGAIGNLVDTTTNDGNLGWGGGTLASGAGSIATAISEIRQRGQLNADVLQALDTLDGSSAGEA